MKDKKIITRRNFLSGAAALTLFSGYNLNVPTSSLSKNRKDLAEPGPMIPPVPAILLTVREMRSSRTRFPLSGLLY